MTFLKINFVQCIIEQLLDSVFVISRIIKVSVKVISLSLRLELIILTSTLITLDITKTSSNNCLLLVCKMSQRKVNFLTIFKGNLEPSGEFYLLLRSRALQTVVWVWKRSSKPLLWYFFCFLKTYQCKPS